jgi:phosphate transport system substrate-binding protein
MRGVGGSGVSPSVSGRRPSPSFHPSRAGTADDCSQAMRSTENRKERVMSSNKCRAFVATALIGLAGAVAPAAAGATTITLSGSTSVAPLAAKLASKYVKQNKGVSFKLLQGGSDIGIADVARGRVTLGMSSRDPKSSDPGGLVFNKIARDAICIITNSDNNIPNLSTSQIQAVFGGSVRDWGAVDGSHLNSTIDVIVRTAASGTQDAFQKIFLGTTKVFSGASQKGSNGLVQQSVSSDTNAIGYVSLAFTKGVNTVPYNGVPCTLENAKSGQYSGVRSFYMVSRGAPTKPAQKWINWIRHNKSAQKIVASEWVPLT